MQLQLFETSLVEPGQLARRKSCQQSERQVLDMAIDKVLAKLPPELHKSLLLRLWVRNQFDFLLQFSEKDRIDAALQLLDLVFS